MGTPGGLHLAHHLGILVPSTCCGEMRGRGSMFGAIHASTREGLIVWRPSALRLTLSGSGQCWSLPTRAVASRHWEAGRRAGEGGGMGWDGGVSTTSLTGS